MCTKKCHKCDTEKNKTEFGADSSKKDKLRTVCRQCSRKYDIERSKNPKRKAYMKAIISEYRLSGKAAISAKGYRARHPKRYSAHKAVFSAIRNGSLIRQCCEVCGDTDSQAHHDDYSKELDVRWLCKEHHREWHVKNGSAINGN